MVVDAYNDFFGYLVDADMRLDELLGYLRHMDEFIRKFDKRKFEKQGQLPTDNEFYLFKKPFPALLHASFVIALAILVEGELKTYCQLLKHHMSLRLNLIDIRGSTLDAFNKFCNKVAYIDTGLTERNWQDIRGFWEIRNCLVHRGGDITDFNKSNVVRDFIHRNNHPTLDGEVLELSRESSELMINLVHDFIDRIYSAALKLFPKQ